MDVPPETPAELRALVAVTVSASRVFVFHAHVLVGYSAIPIVLYLNVLWNGRRDDA